MCYNKITVKEENGKHLPKKFPVCAAHAGCTNVTLRRFYKLTIYYFYYLKGGIYMTTSINKIMKNRKNKKGFSLIELIVVLVIMAILAAALVPTLVGYISQTRQSTAKNEASAVVSAAQTISSSAFADPENKYYGEMNSVELTVTFGANADAAYIGEAKSLAEVTGEIKTITLDDNGKVTYVSYECKNKEKVEYNGSTYEIVDDFTGSGGGSGEEAGS